jgi:hypothetical protein
LQLKKISFCLSDFADAAHLGYDISEKTIVIKSQQSRHCYQPTDTTTIADNILLCQKNNGG